MNTETINWTATAAKLREYRNSSARDHGQEHQTLDIMILECGDLAKDADRPSRRSIEAFANKLGALVNL